MNEDPDTLAVRQQRARYTLDLARAITRRDAAEESGNLEQIATADRIVVNLCEQIRGWRISLGEDPDADEKP